MRETYPDDVAIVLMHRPLDMHKNARPAAIAAQAAHRQGKLWEMHDEMFLHRKELDRDDLLRYAGKIGLDVKRFEADLDNTEIHKEVDTDNEVAQKVGAKGTPAFFINGRNLRGAKPYDAFEEIIKEELVEADKLIESGTPLAGVYDARCKANVAAGVPKPKG